MNETTTETIEWHAVSDRMPEDCEPLLIKHDGDILPVIPATYSYGRFLSVYRNHYNPTHWAYMPKGPK